MCSASAEISQRMRAKNGSVGRAADSTASGLRLWSRPLPTYAATRAWTGLPSGARRTSACSGSASVWCTISRSWPTLESDTEKRDCLRKPKGALYCFVYWLWSLIRSFHSPDCQLQHPHFAPFSSSCRLAAPNPQPAKGTSPTGSLEALAKIFARRGKEWREASIAADDAARREV